METENGRARVLTPPGGGRSSGRLKTPGNGIPSASLLCLQNLSVIVTIMPCLARYFNLH